VSDQLNEPQRRDLTARLAKGIATAAMRRSQPYAPAPSPPSPVRPFAKAPQRALDATVHQWWERQMVAGLRVGRVWLRATTPTPVEFLHAVRDNTESRLAGERPHFFKDFPIEHLLSHYRPPLRRRKRIPYRGHERKAGDRTCRPRFIPRVDPGDVALDVNAAESQVLQGWLMHDHFMLARHLRSGRRVSVGQSLPAGLSFLSRAAILSTMPISANSLCVPVGTRMRRVGYFDGLLQMFSQGT